MNPPVKKLWTSVTFPPNPQTRKLLACLSAGSGRPEPCPHTPRETRKENSRQEAHPQAWGVATAARGPGRLRCRRPFPCFPAQEVSGSNGLHGYETPNGDLSVVLPEGLSGFNSPHLSNEHLLVGI